MIELAENDITKPLSGKIALVTGAGSQKGLGRAIALELATAGANVAITDLASPDNQSDVSHWHGVESVAQEIENIGQRAFFINGDISDANSVNRIVQQTRKQLGEIDIFVANAGSRPGKDRVPVVELDEEAFDLVQRVNVKGTFLCCKAVAAGMLKRNLGGKIVIMSSGLGKRGMAKSAAYSASKFALNGLTQCLAHELGPAGITVNAVCPGAIETDRLSQIADELRDQDETSEERKEKILSAAISQTALGRLGTQEDVANLVSFLVSDRANFLTGLAISVSGGSVMI